MKYCFSKTGKLLSKTLGPTASMKTSNVSLQESLPEPGNYTVQFSVGNITSVPPGIASGNINPYAEIIWSLAGNALRRVVSVANGISITGIAEHVTVNVYDDTDPGDTTQQSEYPITIMVARGVRGSTNLPPIYSPMPSLYTIPKNGARVIAVPQNIGALSVMITAHSEGNVITEADITACQLDATGVTFTKKYDPRDYGFVPLSPDCGFVSVVNDSGSNSVDVSFTFGIDG